MQHLMAVIEDAIYLRDLGVEMANDLTFRVHIANVVTGAIGWAIKIILLLITKFGLFYC